METNAVDSYTSAFTERDRTGSRDEPSHDNSRVSCEPGETIPVMTSTATSPSGLQFRPSTRWASIREVSIDGVGGYVPDLLVTNADLERDRGYEAGWIEQRTGILERRYAAPEQGTSHLAAEAARRACAAAGIETDEIDLLVVGTFTPDYTCPSTACLVQEMLELDAPAFDVQAACSGFVYALATAAQYVATGNASRALVVGADINSRIVDPANKKIAPLFGDGAGAVVISRGDKSQGFLSYQLGADGRGAVALDRPAGGTRHPITQHDLEVGRQYMRMDGRAVFKWAVQAVTQTVQFVCEQAGVSVDDINLFVLHQANVRIITKAMAQLGVPAERVMNNLDRYGNTSAASIPLVLDEAIRAERVRPGDLVLMSGFGAGLTWGTGVWRW